MHLEQDALWNEKNPTHIVTYRKRIFDGINGGADLKSIVEQTGALFDFNQGYRLTGAVSIYAQIHANRPVSDVDICIDEGRFLEVTNIGMKKGYVFCRLAQRELTEGVRTCIFEEVSPEEFLKRKPSVRAVLLNANAQETYAPLDIIDVFVGFVDEQGWENTYDHRMSPIMPDTFPIETILTYETKKIRSVSLEYMAVVKTILIQEEHLFGMGNKIDKEKNEFDLKNILRSLTYFSRDIPMIMEERRRRKVA